MTWSHDSIFYHKVARVVLIRGSSSLSWIHQCVQHSVTDLAPNSVQQSYCWTWQEPTRGLGSKAYSTVFPDGRRATAVGHSLSGRATAHGHRVLLGSPLRLAVDQEPAVWWVQCHPPLGECQRGVGSNWSKGGRLHALLQTVLRLDEQGMWFVQVVDGGYLSSSRLCGFEQHLHMYWNPFSPRSPELYWPDLIMKLFYSFLIPETCSNAVPFQRSTSPLWFILK